MVKISPSTNPPKESNLVEYCKELQELNVDMIHCDLMRENFVGHDCLPVSLIHDIKMNVAIPLDVHVMQENPSPDELDAIIDSGANIITLHYEAFDCSACVRSYLEYVRYSARLVGLSICPDTEIAVLEDFLDIVDVILIMSVVPGKSGQKYIEDTTERIKQVRALVDKSGRHIDIEVDGGINEQNMTKVVSAGADILVMGSAMYNSKNRGKLVELIHSL